MSIDMTTYDPTATLEELGQRNGVTKERIRQQLPGHATGRRCIRLLDEALSLVVGEGGEAVGQVGLDGNYMAGTALWCEDCGRKIRGEGREVAAHTNTPRCCRCQQQRYEYLGQCRWSEKQRQVDLGCSGTTKTGAKCFGPPVAGSDYCRHHQSQDAEP